MQRTARSFDLALAVFLSSAAALMLEIVAGRLIAPYVGMSLYSWTAIIATVLAGLSLGHLIGGRLASRTISQRRGRRRLAVALALAALSSLTVLWLLRLLAAALLARGLPPALEVVGLACGLFFVPSVAAGVVSPLATKLALDVAPERAGPILGEMFALGALGSIVGTLLSGFVLIAWLGSTWSIVVITGTYAGLGLLMLVRQPRALGALSGGFAAASLLIAWPASSWQAFTSPCDAESVYHCIRVEDMAPLTGRPSAALILDHLAHGINDRSDPDLLYSAYLQLADELAKLRFGDRALEAFFIGGGAYTLLRAWARPGARLVVAEIDPLVTEVARQRLWLELSPALEVAHQDARRAIVDIREDDGYHVVLGDAFQDVTIPPHLTTREFNRLISRRLKPSGFYVINLIDARRDPGLLPSLVTTLELDFEQVTVWLDEESWSGEARVTYAVVSTDEPFATETVQATDGSFRRWRRLPRAEFGNLSRGVVLTDDYAPVDRLMQRVTFDASLMSE